MKIHYNILRKMAVALTVSAAVGMACSCASPSATEQKADLEQAQALIDRADYRSAQSICDEIRRLQNTGSERDARILGRLSILYMKLSDAGDHEENVEYAYQCFLEAYSADSIAAQEYYNSLSIDEMPQGVLLAGIVRNAIKMPDMVEIIDTDSIAAADTIVPDKN